MTAAARSSQGSMSDGKRQNGVRRRQIGAIGTTARVVLGTFLFVLGALGGGFSLIHGHLQLNFKLASLALGLLGFPAALVTWQWIRSRRNPSRLVATGALATLLNILVVGLLVGISYVPAISFIGFAAFVFYGASMLLAALRGYAGCEVLAASNWLLHRDDQIGCLVLSPVDALEKRYRRSLRPAPDAHSSA